MTTIYVRCFDSHSGKRAKVVLAIEDDNIGEALEFFANNVMQTRQRNGLNWNDVSMILADMRRQVMGAEK